MICMQFVAVKSSKLSLVWLKAFFYSRHNYIHTFEFTHLSLLPKSLPNGRKDMAVDYGNTGRGVLKRGVQN